MNNPQTKITAMGTVEIPTDEYADLLSAKTRLDVVCDLIVNQTYIDKELLLLVAQGAPPSVQKPEAPEESDPIF